MVRKRADAAGVQRKGINKLTLGFASLAAAAIVGTAGIAAAAQVNATANIPGSGYGNTNIELHVNQSGNNNVFNIIFNFLH